MSVNDEDAKQAAWQHILMRWQAGHYKGKSLEYVHQHFEEAWDFLVSVDIGSDKSK